MKFRQLLLLICVTAGVFLPVLAATSNLERRASAAASAETFHSFSADGAWCWFSDPRAVYFEGNKKAIYAGWVNSRGDIVIGAYDCKTGCVDTAVVEESLEVDDHANPSLLIREDGSIMVFYSRHSSTDGPLTIRISVYPENIHHWSAPIQPSLNDNPAYPAGMRRDYCYTNPVQLSSVRNKIHLFFRGIDFKPCVSISSDNGISWEKARMLVLPDSAYEQRRPYLNLISNHRQCVRPAPVAAQRARFQPGFKQVYRQYDALAAAADPDRAGHLCYPDSFQLSPTIPEPRCAHRLQHYAVCGDGPAAGSYPNPTRRSLPKAEIHPAHWASWLWPGWRSWSACMHFRPSSTARSAMP